MQRVALASAGWIAVWAPSTTSSTGLPALMVEHLVSPWGCNPTTGALYVCVGLRTWSHWAVSQQFNLIIAKQRGGGAGVGGSVAAPGQNWRRGNRTLSYVQEPSVSTLWEGCIAVDAQLELTQTPWKYNDISRLWKCHTDTTRAMEGLFGFSPTCLPIAVAVKTTSIKLETGCIIFSFPGKLDRFIVSD